MKLSLHIGTEKSGTTTIQKFLELNRDLLRDHGVCVPVSLGQGHHRKLSAMFLEDGVVDDFFRHEGLQERPLRIRAKRQWKDDFDAEMEGQTCSHVVISSEHLQSRLRQPKGIRALSDYLHLRFSEIEVILYLRDPLDTAVSLYSTSIKSGGLLQDVPLPDHPYWNNIVNHQETIQRWQANLTLDDLRLRLFQKDDFAQGDLLADFIRTAGLPNLDYVRPERVNESLSHLGIELLRRLNTEIPVFLPNGRVNPMRGGILRFFEAHFSTGQPFLPRAETIAAYETAFAASNDWVRAQFFPGRAQLFVRKPQAVASGAALSPAELDQMAAFTADLWRRWRKKMLEGRVTLAEK